MKYLHLFEHQASFTELIPDQFRAAIFDPEKRDDIRPEIGALLDLCETIFNHRLRGEVFNRGYDMDESIPYVGFSQTGPRPLELHVYKMADEWYYVRVKTTFYKGYGSQLHYYQCDQWSGLTECLQQIKY